MNSQLLAEIVALIVQLGPVALNAFLKLESVMSLGPDEKQNVANAIAAAQAANADTLATLAAWKTANGLT